MMKNEKKRNGRSARTQVGALFRGIFPAAEQVKLKAKSFKYIESS
jgi:hypothetical protein